MCAGPMKLASREHVTRIPGQLQTTTHQVREWVCPECDYFEEVEEAAEG